MDRKTYAQTECSMVLLKLQKPLLQSHMQKSVFFCQKNVFPNFLKNHESRRKPLQKINSGSTYFAPSESIEKLVDVFTVLKSTTLAYHIPKSQTSSSKNIVLRETFFSQEVLLSHASILTTNTI